MGNASYNVLGHTVIIKPNWTEVYVLCGPTSDGTLGVQGWHFKVFPPDKGSLEVLREAMLSGDYLLWPQQSPDYSGIDTSLPPPPGLQPQPRRD